MLQTVCCVTYRYCVVLHTDTNVVLQTDRYQCCIADWQIPMLYSRLTDTNVVLQTDRYQCCITDWQIPMLFYRLTDTNVVLHTDRYQCWITDTNVVLNTDRYQCCITDWQIPMLYYRLTDINVVLHTDRYQCCITDWLTQQQMQRKLEKLLEDHHRQKLVIIYNKLNIVNKINKHGIGTSVSKSVITSGIVWYRLSLKIFS